jgi:outer membrane protein assembly factor BamA
MKRLALFLALCVMSVAIVPRAIAADPEHIIDILVRGNGKVEADAIVTLLKTRKGDVLDPKAIRDDIKALYELGYFRTVRITKVVASGGINLIINVEEKPAIVDIRFEGMSEIEETEIKEKLDKTLHHRQRGHDHQRLAPY